VLLSTYGGRGDELLVALAVRLRAMDAEAPVIPAAAALQRSAAASEISG
jgi:hypothetical protein